MFFFFFSSSNNLGDDGSPADALTSSEQGNSYSALSTAQLDAGKRLRRNRGAVAASQHNTITSAFCLVSGDQEQTDADGRAPSQACDDSINSYAHSGTNRTAGEACMKSEKLLLFRYLSLCVFLLTDTTTTSEYTQEVYQGSKCVHGMP